MTSIRPQSCPQHIYAPTSPLSDSRSGVKVLHAGGLSSKKGTFGAILSKIAQKLNTATKFFAREKFDKFLCRGVKFPLVFGENESKMAIFDHF